MKKQIAVMALQGAFIEHEQLLRRMGYDCFEVREAKDWLHPKDGLILPGGESTTQSKLLTDLGLMDAVRNDIEAGLPTLGTCAGLILLAKQLEGGPSNRLATMDIKVRRNAYGRQLGSFHTHDRFDGIDNVPMTFIRAPYIESVGKDVETLAVVDGHIVAARQGNQTVTAFHPELDDCQAIYKVAFGE
ncbi:MAG: pyridoxal 5'-phosphate synthase glutaminase subunit PdxT [Prevotella sp.]|jgi:5'-phosphate synthase pdxT subunit